MNYRSIGQSYSYNPTWLRVPFMSVDVLYQLKIDVESSV